MRGNFQDIPRNGLSNAVRNWPSPRAEDSEACGNHPDATDSLTGAARDWMTPTAQNFRSRSKGESKGMELLDTQARNWPTPKTPGGGAEARASRKERGAGGEDLEAAVQLWPTPQAHDLTSRGNTPADRHHKPHDLSNAAEVWPTPAARDMKGENSETHCTETGTGRKHMDQLPNYVAHSPLSQAIYTNGPTSSVISPTSPRQLSVLFVEWLMGWPRGWTACGSLAAESFQSWRLTHFLCLRDVLGAYLEAEKEIG